MKIIEKLPNLEINIQIYYLYTGWLVTGGLLLQSYYYKLYY